MKGAADRLCLAPRRQRPPSQRAVGFSSRTCLLVFLIAEVDGRSLALSAQFGDEIEGRAHSRERDLNWDGPGGAASFGFRTILVDESLRSSLRRSGVHLLREAGLRELLLSRDPAVVQRGSPSIRVERGGRRPLVRLCPERAGLGGQPEGWRIVQDDAGTRYGEIERRQDKRGTSLVAPGLASREIDDFDGECGRLFASPPLGERKQQAAIRRLARPHWLARQGCAPDRRARRQRDSHEVL